MKPVDAGVPPKFTLREDRQAGTTDSWRTWAENREVEEWMQSVAGVLPQGWNDNAANQQGPRHYEFPTGYNNYFTGVERYAVGEQFFMHSAQLVVSFHPVLLEVCYVITHIGLNAPGVEPESAQDNTLSDHELDRSM